MTTEREHELLTEIAALQLELLRLTQCDINMKFLLDCLEKAEYELPDYTLGTWQERAKGLAPAIIALRTRLDWLVVEIDKMVDDYASYPSDGLADWTVIINLAKLVGRWKDNGDGSGCFTLLSGRGGR